MLPLTQLNQGEEGTSGINLLAITPGTSLKFGRSTGSFKERCLAYTFLPRTLGRGGHADQDRAANLLGRRDGQPRQHGLRGRRKSTKIAPLLANPTEVSEVLSEIDHGRHDRHQPTVGDVFDQLVDGLGRRRNFPAELGRTCSAPS